MSVYYNRRRSVLISEHQKEARQPGDSIEETTAWEIYNHKATEIDTELIKDWNENLNLLLIFVSYYLLPPTLCQV